MANLDYENLIGDEGLVHHAKKYKGMVERRSYFSSNNPYFSMLENTSHGHSEQLADLYAKAYDYEADQAIYLQQLRVNEALKNEQREYDSMESQVARARAAGVNLDIQASAGGGSSGSGSASAPQQPSQLVDSNSQWSDRYAGKYYSLAALEAAGGFIQQIASSVGIILDSTSQMKVLPSQINLNEAQAGLMDAQANSINSLLPGQIEGQTLQNAGQQLNNTNAFVGQLAKLSRLIVPEINDNDLTNTLTGLGYTTEQIPSASSIIRQFHKDPNLLNEFVSGDTKLRWSHAENAIYTKELVSQMVDLDQRTQYLQQQAQFETTELQKNIASILNTPEFADILAGNEMLNAEVNQQSLELAKKQLIFDTEAFLRNLEIRASNLEIIEHDMDQIVKFAKSQNREMSAQERATYDRLYAEYTALYTCTSQQFHEIKQSYLDAAQQMYHYKYATNGKGGLNPAIMLELANMYSDATFNDVIYHTKTVGDVANQWVNTAISGAAAIGTIAIGKGMLTPRKKVETSTLNRAEHRSRNLTDVTEVRTRTYY